MWWWLYHIAITTGDLLLLATLKSKKCRAWYGFMLTNTHGSFPSW